MISRDFPLTPHPSVLSRSGKGPSHRDGFFLVAISKLGWICGESPNTIIREHFAPREEQWRSLLVNAGVHGGVEAIKLHHSIENSSEQPSLRAEGGGGGRWGCAEPRLRRGKEAPVIAYRHIEHPVASGRSSGRLYCLLVNRRANFYLPPRAAHAPIRNRGRILRGSLMG